MDKKTLKAKIEIEAIVKQAQSEVNNFTESINQMWQHSTPPKKLLKQVEDLQLRIESLRQLTESGVINSSDLSQAQGDYKAISKEIRNLTFEFSSLTEAQKRAFLSSQERQEIEARNKAVANYTASLEKNKKILEEIEAIQSKKQPKTEELNTKTATRDTKVQERSKLVAPEQTDEVKEYIKNLERLTEIQRQIKTNEKTLANLRAQGRSSGKQYTNAEENLATLRAEEAQLSKGQEAYEEYTAALKTYEEAVKPLEADIKILNGEISTLEAEIKDLDGQLAKLETQKVDASLDNLKDTLKDLGVEGLEAVDSLDDIKTILNDLEKSSLRKIDGQIENVVEELKNLGKTAKQAKEGLDNANESLKEQEETLSRTQAFADRIKQFVGLAGAAQVLSKAIRSSFEATKELDAVMTEMAVVTDLKVGDYWEQLPEHTARASELGVAIKEVYEAETLYYQQGLKTNEVTSMSVETLKMARIAGLSAEDATNKMTAALRGFNMELNQTSAQKVADVYSELAAITASDVNEISSAMTKTASIASSAGMEFETTAAFLSQIIETTRESAETAGTAMKTVIARFQELKKDPAEIGEVDGEIVDANAIETALRSVGVSLRDANGQFRELDDVFLELSSKWDSLDKNTQRYIATIAAGSRQQSRFIAMMSDFERTQELVNAANTSAGASNKQYEKTLDSLQSKLERLKNAWTSFTQGIANSKLIKAGIDILTKLLETINKLTDSFGKFSGAAKIALLVTALYLGDKAVKVFMTSIKDTKSVFASLGAVFTQTGSTIKADIDGLTNKMRQFAAEASYVKDYYNSFGAGASEPLKEYRDALRATAEANKKLNKAEKEGKQSSAEYIQLTKAKKKAMEQEKIAADKIRNSYLQNTQQQKLYDIAVKNGMQADRAAIMVTNEKVLAILREKGAIDELNNVIDENIAKDTLDSISNSTNAATSFGKSLSDLGTKMSNFKFGEFFNGLKGGLKSVGKGFLNVIKQIGSFIAANWQLILVLAVLVVAIIGLVHYLKYLERNSPEGKLKAATEAADRAAEAANRATEAYKELSDGFKSLDDKYKNLENLTKGTREWKDAVQEINDEVLELINNNPELASLYENVDGVLKLKEGSEGQVEEALNKRSLEAAQAKAIKSAADLKVKKAEQDVAYSNLSDKAKYGRQELIRGVVISGTVAGAAAGAAGGAAIGYHVGSSAGAAVGGAAGYGVGAAPGYAIGAGAGTAIGAVAGGIAGGILGGVGAHAGLSAAFEETNKSDKELTETIAKDMASGKFNPKDLASFTNYLQNEFNMPVDAAQKWAKELSQATEELQDFGASLNIVDEQEKAHNEAMAQAALNSLDLSSYSKKSQELITGAASGEAYATQTEQALLEAEELAKNKDSYNDMKEEVAKAMYGEGATVKGDKITYKDGDEEKEVTLSKEEWKANYAAMKSTEELAKSLELIPGIVDTIANDLRRINYDLGKDFGDLVAHPDKLLVGQVENLSQVSDETLSNAYSKLTKEQQDYYGSEEKFISWYKEELKDQNLVISEAKLQISKYTNGVSTLNGKMNTSNVKAFTKSLAGLQDALPSTGATIASVIDNIDQISGLIPTDQFNTFMQLWNSFDHSDLEAWKEFETTLKGLGLENILLSSSYQQLALQTKDLANAVTKVDINSLGDKIGEIDKLAEKISSENSREFDRETYEALIQIDETLESSFVQLGDSFYYLGNSIEDLVDTLQQEKVQLLEMAHKQLKSQVTMQHVSKVIDGQQTYYGRTTKIEYQYLSDLEYLDRIYKSLETDEQKNQMSKDLENYEKLLDWETKYGHLEPPEEIPIKSGYEEGQEREIGDETTDPYAYAKDPYSGNEIPEVPIKGGGEAGSEKEIDYPEKKPEFTKKEMEGIKKIEAYYDEYIEERKKGKEGKAYKGEKTVVTNAGTLLDISQGDYESWSDEAAISYVTDFLKDTAAKVADGTVSKDVLSYLEYNGESVGLQFDTNVSALDRDSVNKILGGIYTLNQMTGDARKTLEKVEKQQRIQTYVLESTAAGNKEAIDLSDTSVNGRRNNVERSTALLTQGIQAGIISESVIATYNDLIYLMEKGRLNEEQVKKLDNLQKDMVKHLEVLESQTAGVPEIIAYEDRVANILASQAQKEIDALTELNDNITDANNKLLNKLQKQINENRQKRDLEEKEENLNSNYSYLAYLNADSSGASQLEAQSVDEEIQQAEQDYEDSLIDAQLQIWQDANDAAAEQREREIAILEAILEQNQITGEYNRQAEEIVAISLEQINSGISPLETELGRLIATEDNWGILTNLGLQAAQAEFVLGATVAANGLNNLTSTTEKASETASKDLDTLSGEINAKTLNETVMAIRSVLEQEYGTYKTETETTFDENGNPVATTTGKFTGGGKSDQREDAIKRAVATIGTVADGLSGAAKTEAYKKAKSDYIAADGEGAEFDSIVQGRAKEVTTGRLPEFKATGYHNSPAGAFDDKLGYGGVTGLSAYNGTDTTQNGATSAEKTKQITICTYPPGTAPVGGDLVLYDNEAYIYRSKPKRWAKVIDKKNSKKPSVELATVLREQLNTFQTGGLADFTGPAWLDGTKAHPELVLNARDTQNFIQLKDILADILDGTNHTTNNSQNKQNTVNTIDIDINVESIGDDYDVEQLADKIRSMLYDDATYRNVNTISLSH